MKLGIVVVYMLQEEDESLLRFHLDTIERHTALSYTIHAGANRLSPRFRAILAARPNVVIHHCPLTESRARLEHAWYLEHLIAKAIEDEASHIAILHVDSFPVCDGWAESLASLVTGKCVLATMHRNGRLERYTACLFFTRAFYLEYRPSLLLRELDRCSKEYQCFKREFRHHPEETGAGYCFRAYQAGLSWHALQEAIPDPHRELRGNIYGRLIFHLDGAFRSAPAAPDTDGFGRPVRLCGIRAWSTAFLRRYLRGLHHHFFLRPALQQSKRSFLSDPENYVNWFRMRAGLPEDPDRPHDPDPSGVKEPQVQRPPSPQSSAGVGSPRREY